MRAPPAQGPAENLLCVSKLHCPSSRGDGPEVPRNCTNQYSPIVPARLLLWGEWVMGQGAWYMGSVLRWGKGRGLDSQLEGERLTECSLVPGASARVG